MLYEINHFNYSVNRLIHFVLLALLVACSEQESDSDKDFITSDLSLNEKLKLACEDDFLTAMGCSEDDINSLQSLYQASNYKPFWINDSTLTAKGKELEKISKNPVQVAIPHSRLSQVKAKNFIEYELAISLQFMRFGGDLKTGFFDLESNKILDQNYLDVPSARQLFNSITRGDSTDLRLQFLAYCPQDSSYQRLFRGLVSLYDRISYDTTHFVVKTVKQDSIESFKMTRVALESKGYVKDAANRDSMHMDSILKIFQVDNGLNPDGKIGKYTVKALNESNAEKFHRIILAMEKIRNKQRYPSKYLEINLPEYMLRFVEQDSLRSEHRIVIGTTENQTPELESKLNKIVVYPYWNVPYSISSKEILPAVKNNVAYLDKHNYKVYRKDELIDPTTVNWKGIRENAFPYKIVQDPGPKNSLGVLKFDFHNSHSVYFHDTPAKALFSTDVRSYSHGCMRTHKPIDLAKKILEYDSIPRRRNDILPDSLDSLLARAKNYEIRLIDRIPIFIIYQTVTVDHKGMIVHIDIYDRDKKFIKTMMQS